MVVHNPKPLNRGGILNKGIHPSNLVIQVHKRSEDIARIISHLESVSILVEGAYYMIRYI